MLEEYSLKTAIDDLGVIGHLGEYRIEIGNKELSNIIKISGTDILGKKWKLNSYFDHY